jgi:hypothetical protein
VVSMGSGVSKEPGVLPAPQVGVLVSLRNVGSMYQTTRCPNEQSAAWLFALKISNLRCVEPFYVLVVRFSGNRCSSVGIVSRLRVERPMHHDSVPAEGKRCFSFPNVCTGSGPDSVFRRVKRPGREATSLSHLVPCEE